MDAAAIDGARWLWRARDSRRRRMSRWTAQVFDRISLSPPSWRRENPSWTRSAFATRSRPRFARAARRWRGTPADARGDRVALAAALAEACADALEHALEHVS